MDRSTIATAFALGLAVGSTLCACKDSSASSAEPPSRVDAVAAAPATAQAEITTLPGIDTSAMTPRERHAWASLVTDLLAPCPNVPVPVAQCVQEHRACATCATAAKWVAMAVRGGAPADEIQRAYRERFDPSLVKTLPIDDSPTQGPADAPITIVELADFECPHCREAVKLIEAVMTAHPGKIRLVYKTFTLPFHTRGEPAARAAFAAGVQGKFWEMQHTLFEHQPHFEDADLEHYARALKLDIVRWQKDMASPAIKGRLEHDHRLGEDLKLKGTPTIYVNGRELNIEEDESLEDRVASELEIPGAATPAATPPAPAAARDGG